MAIKITANFIVDIIVASLVTVITIIERAVRAFAVVDFVFRITAAVLITED